MSVFLHRFPSRLSCLCSVGLCLGHTSTVIVPIVCQSFTLTESLSYIIEGGVCYLTLCERSYLKKLAYQYLEELQREFEKVNRSQIETVASPYAFIKFGKSSETTACLRSLRALDRISCYYVYLWSDLLAFPLYWLFLHFVCSLGENLIYLVQNLQILSFKRPGSSIRIPELKGISPSSMTTCLKSHKSWLATFKRFCESSIKCYSWMLTRNKIMTRNIQVILRFWAGDVKN